MRQQLGRQQLGRKGEPARDQRQPHGTGRVTRLPRGERHKTIVAAAAHFFAEYGFQGGTRALASRLGVTQALLYRYFRSKDDLIDAVLEALAERRQPPEPSEILEGDPPLADRAGDLFVAYLGAFDPVDLRLMLRAALDGLDMVESLDGQYRRRLARPTVAALRAETELPDLGQRPMLVGEREMTDALYGSVLFTAARKALAPPPEEPYEPAVRLHARLFVTGARHELPLLHALPPDDPLARPASHVDAG